MRNVTHVPAILKLAQIVREILPADVNMGSVDAALQHRPEALNRLCVSALGQQHLIGHDVSGWVPVRKIEALNGNAASASKAGGVAPPPNDSSPTLEDW